MTTKEQERKALAQIRKIVDGLGEGSYIGTAFEGCFELAESNIEYDFGESMQDRADCYKRTLEDREKKLKEVYQELQATEMQKNSAARKLEATEKSADSLRYELAKARGEAQQLREFVENAKKVYAARIKQLEQNMLSAADMLAAYAEAPQDIAYQGALKNYRTAKAERDDLRAELNKLGE